MVLGEMGRSKLAKFIEFRMGIFVQESLVVVIVNPSL